MEVLGKKTKTLEELHLSDCYIGYDGLKAIINAIVGCAAYPVAAKGKLVPMWLRVNGNIIKYGHDSIKADAPQFLKKFTES